MAKGTEEEITLHMEHTFTVKLYKVRAAHKNKRKDVRKVGVALTRTPSRRETIRLYANVQFVYAHMNDYVLERNLIHRGRCHS